MEVVEILSRDFADICFMFRSFTKIGFWHKPENPYFRKTVVFPDYLVDTIALFETRGVNRNPSLAHVRKHVASQACARGRQSSACCSLIDSMKPSLLFQKF